MRRAAVLAGLLGLFACDQPNNHLLEGQAYDPQANCLGPASAIDDLPGADPGDNCAPTCIFATGEDETVLYVTTTCPPYPQYTAEFADAAMKAGDPCTAALALYGNPDAGVCTGEAGVDAGLDAPHDGAADGASDAGEAGGDASDAGAVAEGGMDATMPAESGAEAAVESGADATRE